jgi:hypothetical protein
MHKTISATHYLHGVAVKQQKKIQTKNTCNNCEPAFTIGSPLPYPLGGLNVSNEYQQGALNLYKSLIILHCSSVGTTHPSSPRGPRNILRVCLKIWMKISFIIAITNNKTGFHWEFPEYEQERAEKELLFPVHLCLKRMPRWRNTMRMKNNISIPWRLNFTCHLFRN